jgi:hypothetical protein
LLKQNSIQNYPSGKLFEVSPKPVLQLPSKPWTIANCTALDQRDELVAFWLAAPEDILPSLWASPVGEATKSLVRGLRTDTSFTAEQVALRNAIGAKLSNGFQAPMAIQCLIANFLYSPPGLLKIVNANNQLPSWLLGDYLAIYEQPSPSQQVFQSPPPATTIPEPDFGVFPATLQELVGNRIQLNRLLGLSNLYYIDPEDQEILKELRQIRLSLIEAIERCPEDQFESLWSTDLGDRYWALVRSGVQKEAMTPVEEHKKQTVTQKLTPGSGGGFGSPGALNAFLIAMVLYEPGSMRVNDPERQLPSWLLPSYKQIFADPLAQQA